MLDYIRHLICKNNYKNKIKQIKKISKTRPINVVFIALENEKWGYQALYESLQKDSRFNPIVLVGIHYDIHKKKDCTKYNLEENYEFFKQKGIKVEYIYQNGKYKNLKDFKPDMVFYEQQWGLPKILRPEAVSKYALTFYCPYGLSLLNYKSDYMRKFHSYLYKYFVDSNCNIERFETYHKGNSNNCTPVGYSKLDEYLDDKRIDLNKYWKDSDKFKIIYSPHHSFDAESLRMATFRENGQLILNLAKNNPSTTWIFKPHPRLKFALLKNNIMSENEVEEYYREWEAIGNVYLQGDYLNIFKSSDLMITDCCSFLAEYLPSGKPLIRLVNKDSTALNLLGQEVVKGYYETSNNNELEETFKQIVLDKNDPKRDVRNDSQSFVIDFNQKSSEKILLELKKIVDVGGANA